MPKAATKSCAVREVHSGLRRRTGLVVALSLLALAVLLPVGVVAQTTGPSYSGVADAYVVQALLAPSPTQPAPLEVTLAETTGAVNSAAGIIPDSPGSPEDESEDFSVGTATPLRLAAGGEILAQPFSVQSSAPADAGGSNALLDIDEPPVTLQLLRAETQSQAALDASTAATQNNVRIANAVLQDVLTLPAGTSNSDVSRTADGTVRGFSDCAVDEPTTLLADPATGGGLITAQAITASSESTANGTTSNNTTDFRVLGLELAGAEGVTIDAVPSPDNPDFVRVTLTLGGGEVLTADVPRGVNLLDPSTFPEPATGGADVPLGELLAGLEGVLTPLTGTGGPLEGTELILGGGFSDDGDGTYARGLIEAVRVGVGIADSPVTSVVVCSAYSAVDAVRANSTATDPNLPPGTVPTDDPANAFPGPREATPAETIFTNPVPQAPAPEPEPEPAPEPEPEPEPEEEPEEEEVEFVEEAEPELPVEVVEEELPFTGLGLAAIAGMGALLLAGGGAVRRFSRRRGIDSLGDQAQD